jgi:Mrp family chromosome partitioning ATPase
MKTSERWAEGPTVIESAWRFRQLVLVVTILAGLAGYLYAQSQPEVYEASTRMYLSNPATSGVFQQSGINLDRYLPQQTERIRSSRVLTAAAEELGDDIDPSSIRRQLTVDGDADLATLTVTVEDGSPERAAAIANAVASAYQEDVRSSQLERVQRAVEELECSAADIQEQIDALLAEATTAEAEGGADQAASQVGVLTQRLVEIDALGQQLLVDARIFGSGIEFVEEAEAPTSPIAPTPRRTAAATAVLGALLAAAFAYWRAGHGRKIASRDEPGEVLGAPLLGVLPTYKPAQHVTLTQRTTLEPRMAEAYRFVYSSLGAILREHGARSVMVTSASPAIGKTETALQLAATAARRGQSVLLIDADLRMRGLTSFLRADRAPGLLDLAEPQDELHAESFIRRYPLDRQRYIDVLTTGRPTGDDPGHLSESWFGSAFDGAVAAYDLTVVDSPPLLAVADTTTIAGYTDAIILVVRDGSELEELERVSHRLRFVQQRLVGYIYLTPNALDDTDFDYGLVRSSSWPTLEPTPPAPTTPGASQRGWHRWQDAPPHTPERSTSVRKLPDDRGRAGRREPRI